MPKKDEQTQSSAIETKATTKEIIAEWEVPIRGKLYRIEFEHGTTSGRRIIWVDGQASEPSRHKNKSYNNIII